VISQLFNLLYNHHATPQNSLPVSHLIDRPLSRIANQQINQLRNQLYNHHVNQVMFRVVSHQCNQLYNHQ
jgi:hypothetical protein